MTAFEEAHIGLRKINKTTLALGLAETPPSDLSRLGT